MESSSGCPSERDRGYLSSLHRKTKCRQNRFMSCHKFDWGNEKYSEKLGTRVRWHHSNDILNLEYVKINEFSVGVSWGSGRLEVIFWVEIHKALRVSDGEGIFLYVSVHRPKQILSLSLSLSLSRTTVCSLNIKRLCI